MSLLPDASQLIELIKQVAVAAVEASKPVKLVYGRVASVSPLSVRLDQRTTLTAGFLRRLHYGGVTAEGEAVSVYSFKVGDSVALLRMQGGQEYLILGKED